jgi:hypothetical protein
MKRYAPAAQQVVGFSTNWRNKPMDGLRAALVAEAEAHSEFRKGSRISQSDRSFLAALLRSFDVLRLSAKI